MRAKLEIISQKTKLAEAIRYALSRWAGRSLFLDDGHIELDNNTVERSIRPLALNRKNALFAGSDGGAKHWAVLASLIETAKLNDINPEAYLADVVTRIVGSHPQSQMEVLCPGPTQNLRLAWPDNSAYIALVIFLQTCGRHHMSRFACAKATKLVTRLVSVQPKRRRQRLVDKGTYKVEGGMRSTELHRWLDRTIGVPLIAVASAFRRRRALPSSAGRIAILQPTAIGDTLITSGIPAAVFVRYPDAHIDILHGASNASAMDMIDADFTARTVDFRRPHQVLRTLRSLKPEIVVDLSPWPRLTALCAMASGAITVGYNSTGQGRGPAFDIPVEHRSDRHELANAAAMAAVFAPDRLYRAAVRAPVVQAQLDLPFERLVLFHTTCGGSRRLDRAWTVEKWTELARRLGGEGYVIGFTGVKAEIPEIEPLRIAASAHAETLMLAGSLSLSQLTHVLAASRALISLDTGTVHIGSSLNIPVVGLYGPARALRWGPWSSAGVGVDSPHPSAGYSIFGFETSRDCRAIMDAITVEAVYEAFQTVVRSLPRGPSS